MTMAIDDEQFFAWLDGELDAALADLVAAAVAADPRLSRLAEQHRALGTQLRSSFAAVAEAPVPERLSRAVRPSSAEIIDFAASRPRNAHSARWLSVPQWAAMAATLVLGIGLGTALNTESALSPVEVRGGKMFAAGQLDSTLDRQLTSAAPADGARVGLTFRDQSGTICRTFTDPRSTGLACREGEGWHIRGLFAAPEGQSGDYRMAAGSDPNLAALVDSAIQGEAFDAQQEEAAKARGWR
jgi:hypothetical protein